MTPIPVGDKINLTELFFMHPHEEPICRKRPRSARECARTYSFLEGLGQMKKNRAGYNWKNYIAVILFSALAAAGAIYLSVSTEFYLNGASIYGQFYKIEAMLEGFAQGRIYPLYTEQWYNGYEIFRCTSPVPYLCAAVLVRLSGSMDMGIAMFYGALAFLAMWGFLLFGMKWKKLPAAGLTGTAFLLSAPVLYAAAGNGSLDILFAMALLPWLMCSAMDFLEHQNRKALLPFCILMALLAASHYILSIVFGMVFLLYLFLRIVIRRSWKHETALAGNLVLSYVLMAYFLYPAITGGIFTRDYSAIGEWNLKAGGAMLLIAAAGLFLTERSRAAGFVITVLAVGLSFDVFEPVRRLLPSEALQKPYWYLIVGTVFGLVMLLRWERLRMTILVLLLGLLIGEGSALLLTTEDGAKVRKADNAVIENYLIDEAVHMTDNRIAVLDDGLLGDSIHYYIALQGVKSMYGWDVENGLTTREQLNLAEAFTDGFYEYLFGATFLYGNDVVVVVKRLLTDQTAWEQLLAAAARRGYVTAAENENALVLKAEQVTSPYGVISTYENLAIGEHANSIAYIYPSFEVGHSRCLEDYTVEELAEYKRLYLSGFTYREKTKAESLLREAADKGVRIYIDMQHIPKNKLTGKNEFMNIYAQFIQFTEDFPVLSTNSGNQFKLSFQTTTDTTWNTVYVSGCTEVLKEAAYEKKKHLAYLGRGRDENITFMGFNLAFYYLAVQNKDLRVFLDEVFEIEEDTAPVLELIPIELKASMKEIRIVSPRDHVNCNIAAVDALIPDRIISQQESMWVVNENETVFEIERSDSAEGLLLSAIGLMGMALLWIVIYVVLEPEEKRRQQLL